MKDLCLICGVFVYRKGRHNANGVDLNRNFPKQFDDPPSNSLQKLRYHPPRGPTRLILFSGLQELRYYSPRGPTRLILFSGHQELRYYPPRGPTSLILFARLQELRHYPPRCLDRGSFTDPLFFSLWISVIIPSLRSWLHEVIILSNFFSILLELRYYPPRCLDRGCFTDSLFFSLWILGVTLLEILTEAFIPNIFSLASKISVITHWEANPLFSDSKAQVFSI
jgi:hypothetical protein